MLYRWLSHILLEKQTQAVSPGQKRKMSKSFSFSAPLSTDSELDISRTQLHDNISNANQYRQHELKPKCPLSRLIGYVCCEIFFFVFFIQDILFSYLL